MSHMLKISDAASLGLHAMVVLTGSTDKWLSAHEMATVLCVSENHLAKVCQRLAKAGLVEGTRGPKGGFKLAKVADDITLLDIYQAIDGPMTPSHCLLGHKVCGREVCLLGELMDKINNEVIGYFSSTTLAKFIEP